MCVILHIGSLTFSLLALEECCYLDQEMRVPSDWTWPRQDMICRLTLTYRSEGWVYVIYLGAEMLIQKLYPVPRTRTCRCDLLRHRRASFGRTYHTKCTYTEYTERVGTPTHPLYSPQVCLMGIHPSQGGGKRITNPSRTRNTGTFFLSSMV